MRVLEDTINLGYLLVEKYMVVPKTGIIIPGVQGLSPHAIGKIMIGEDKGKFVLFPAHVGYDVDTRYQKLLFIPKREIIAYVEPEENENFKPYQQINPTNPNAEWV